VDLGAKEAEERHGRRRSAVVGEAGTKGVKSHVARGIGD
jgi:hypothetical protein